jgi:hypothetical protein
MNRIFKLFCVSVAVASTLTTAAMAQWYRAILSAEDCPLCLPQLGVRSRSSCHEHEKRHGEDLHAS